MERRWKVLIVTAVAVFVSFLDVTIVNVAFPDIEKNFAGTAQADWASRRQIRRVARLLVELDAAGLRSRHGRRTLRASIR